MPYFKNMNETDVREIIVRPLLERLGYRHGTEANIKTEQRLKYDRAYLGRKNPKKDPPLVGRADYICEVISFGRWVVEVKGPGDAIGDDTIQQAHTYSAHPEIAATHFMVTNGREFQVFRTGDLAHPVLKWPFERTEEFVLPLFNLLAPAAVKKRASLSIADPGKPLGRGMGSRVEIIGGDVTYDNHASNNPMFAGEVINGLKLPVTGGYVQRAADGRLHAHVEVAKSAAIFREINDLLGVDGYEFYSPSEYVSTDAEHPTLFQNYIASKVKKGATVTLPPLGKIPIPMSLSIAAVTEAIGYFEGDVFKGVMQLSYDCIVTDMEPQVRTLIERQSGQIIPSHSQFAGEGTFTIRVRDAFFS